MPRITALLVGWMLVLVVGITAVAGATTALSAGAWIGGVSQSGLDYIPTDICATGYFDEAIQPEYRCALEFDISGLPAGATITAATLSLRTELVICAGGGCLVDIAGYVGNGTGELADLTDGTTLLTFPLASSGYEDHNVTTFVSTLHASAEGWAGFRLSKNSNSIFEDAQQWDSPQDTFPPILTITYDLPSSPAASALPNAAMAAPGPAQPVAVVGFGLLLALSLGALAYANLRSRPR